MHARTLLVCLMLLFLSAAAGGATEPRMNTGRHQESSGNAGANAARISSVLSTAKDAAESAATEQERRSLRGWVANAMRLGGHEAALDGYVAAALREWEPPPQPHFPSNPEGEARWQRHKQLQEEAKRAFFAGDLQSSKQLLAEAEPLQESHEPIMNEGLRASFEFMRWELGAGRLDAALERLRTTRWTSPFYPFGPAFEAARTYVAAGRQAEGIGILLEAAQKPEVSASTSSLQALGEEIWKLGAEEDGKRVIRDAVAVALAAAKRDPKQGLPVDLPRVQLAMNDRDGAIETLRRIQEFAAPIEFEPPQPRPPHLPPSTLWFAAPNLKPASDRWLKARNYMAWILARAGLYTDAIALLDEPLADQPAILESIVRGQAERGDLSAAFESFERLRTGPSTMSAEPPSVTFHPDGSITSRRPTSPTRPADEKARAAALASAAYSLARGAARLGDGPKLDRAYSAGQAANPDHWKYHVVRFLRDLVKFDHLDVAVSFALRAEDATTRVSRLLNIVDILAGRLGPPDDPLRP